jgi:hypothetical protein
MTVSKTKFDSRLIGVWKSDRRRTFPNYKPNPGVSPEKLRRFQLIFVKLVVRWGRGRYWTDFNGDRSVDRYTVVAKDKCSVVVRSREKFSGEDRLQYIHYEGDYYWITTSGGICEYFKRIK